MSDVAVELEQWAQSIIETLSPQNRRKLLRQIMLDMRRETKKRITANKDPEGEAWKARKQPKRRRGKDGEYLRDKKGKIKREKRMMLGLKKNSVLRAKATADEGTLGYTGFASHVASVHHYGLVDKIAKYNPQQYRFPKRQILGLTDGNMERIEQRIVDFLR